jgi:hypothetical protein
MPTTAGKSADPKRPAVSSPPFSGAAGLSEDRAEFETARPGMAFPDFAFPDSGSVDATRFSDSLALIRSFNLIDSDAARQQVLALARRLAGE